MVTRRRIVALGGYSGQIDEWLVGLVGKEHPKVCFIPTASGDNRTAIGSFYRQFRNFGCCVSCLRLYDRKVKDVEALLLEADIIYVGGGNTADMLETWREHDVDLALKKAWEAGVILAGASAGAICWFESGISDSIGELGVLEGALGFLPGCCAPHYTDPDRKFELEWAVQDRRVKVGTGIEDGAAACFLGTELKKVVAVGNAGVHRLDVDERGDLRKVEMFTSSRSN